MKSLLVLVALAGAAHADSLEAIVRAQVEPALPAPLGVTKVFAPRGDYDPATVTVELPRELRAGRPSVKVVAGKRTLWVPVNCCGCIVYSLRSAAVHASSPRAR